MYILSNIPSVNPESMGSHPSLRWNTAESVGEHGGDVDVVELDEREGPKPGVWWYEVVGLPSRLSMEYTRRIFLQGVSASY